MCDIINMKDKILNEIIKLDGYISIGSKILKHNAKKSLEAKFIELASKDEDIFIELGSYLNLSRVSTIEMCDMSHISGDSAVGVVIVFQRILDHMIVIYHIFLFLLYLVNLLLFLVIFDIHL